MNDDQVLWQIRRRPHLGMLWWSLFLGVALGIGSALVVQALLIDRNMVIAATVGAGLGAFLVGSIYQGSEVRVERGGRLIYALRGADCVAVDLHHVTAMRHLQTGALSGIGLEAPLTALQFLSRKGVSRAHCESLQKHQGVAVVLEFLHPEDVEPLLAAWHQALAE